MRNGLSIHVKCSLQNDIKDIFELYNYMRKKYLNIEQDAKEIVINSDYEFIVNIPDTNMTESEIRAFREELYGLRGVGSITIYVYKEGKVQKIYDKNESNNHYWDLVGKGYIQ